MWWGGCEGVWLCGWVKVCGGMGVRMLWGGCEDVW